MNRTLDGTQSRLAHHYLEKLRTAERMYLRGGEDAVYGLKLAQQDWQHIQHWQAWAVAHAAHHREAAELCSAFPYQTGRLLDILLPSKELRPWYETALTQARRLGDQIVELAHLLALGEVCWRMGEPADALVQQALALAAHLRDECSRAHALRILGYNAYFRSNYPQAQSLFEQSLALCRRLNDEVGIARNLIGLVMIMERRGEFSGTIRAYAEESLNIFRKLGDHRGTAQALNALGKSLKNDDPERAITYLEEGIRLLRVVGNLNDIIDLYVTLSNVLALTRQYHFAKKLSEEALGIFRQQGIRHGVMSTLRYLGSLELSVGDFELARTHAEQSLEIARELDSQWDIGVNLMNLGTISSILSEYERGYIELIVAEGVLRQIEAPIDLAYTLVLLASVNRGLGDAEKTRTCLCEAFHILSKRSYPLALTLAVTNTAGLYLLNGDAERCARLLGTVDAYPMTTPPVRRFGIGKIRHQAEVMLGSETVARLMDEGRSQDFHAAVAQIMNEFAQG